MLVRRFYFNVNNNLLLVFLFLSSFSFEISSPSTGSILKLLRFQKKIQVKSFDRSLQKDILCVKLKDLISLALFKFPYLDLKSSFPVI